MSIAGSKWQLAQSGSRFLHWGIIPWTLCYTGSGSCCVGSLPGCPVGLCPGRLCPGSLYPGEAVSRGAVPWGGCALGRLCPGEAVPRAGCAQDSTAGRALWCRMRLMCGNGAARPCSGLGHTNARAHGVTPQFGLCRVLWVAPV